MKKCCNECRQNNTPAHSCCAGSFDWFADMIQHCYDYASGVKAKSGRVVGIMCEYTPREIIMAAQAVPVCLCGGSVHKIQTAEKHLPANLCPLIKSTYGYHLEKANPFLEMADLIVAETTCDGKKKMYELMQQGRKMYVLELPQKPADADARHHWARELTKFKTFLEKEFCVEITDEKLRSAIKLMNRERLCRRQLAELMKSDTPPITGRQLLDFKSIISCIPADIEQYGKAISFYKKDGCSCKKSDRVRVLLTGVPVVHGAERVVEIIENSGGIIVCMENCTGLRPILDDVDESTPDPMQAIADKYLDIPCSVMTDNRKRLELISRLAKEYKVQCVIDLVWQACLTYDVESYFIKQLVEESLGIPYLKIETDYSPSDTERIAVRIEALFETVHSKCSG